MTKLEFENKMRAGDCVKVERDMLEYWYRQFIIEEVEVDRPNGEMGTILYIAEALATDMSGIVELLTAPLSLYKDGYVSCYSPLQVERKYEELKRELNHMKYLTLSHEIDNINIPKQLTIKSEKR